MNNLQERLKNLSIEQRKLVISKVQQQNLRQNQQQNHHRKMVLAPVSRGQTIPLSYAQQRLWFLWQLEGPSATYNIPTSLRLSGKLNVSALQEAIHELVRRHEVLRTSFPMIDGLAQQVIAPSLKLPLRYVDLSALAHEEQATKLNQLLFEDANHLFNLTQGPLLQVSLYCLAPQEHTLMFNIHHIISDAWSRGVVLREVKALYEAFVVGKPSPLPPLAYQYADFAVWQRNWLQGERLAQQLDYWRNHLAGAPSLLELPTDHPRPSVQSYRGAALSFSVDREVGVGLQQLSKQEGVSLFMTLFAAFAVLLARYSGQDDLVIGTPIANRHYQELEGLIGFFVNSLALRVQLREKMSFIDLLQQVRQVTLDGQANQDIGFEQLVSELQIERTLSHNPLFQVMFTLINNQRQLSSQAQLLGDVHMSRLPVESVISKFDLSLALEEENGHLWGNLEYNADLFERSTIERMAGHLQVLLRAIADNPKQPVESLPLLTQTERQMMLVTWNETGRAYPLDKCFHQLFEEQVERTPDAVALIFGEQQLTYRQLDCRANQLAHHLQTLGASPEQIVGICLDRSVEMMVALLGVFKAGCAYVPLDPNYSAERLIFMIEDVEAPIILTQQQYYAKLAALEIRTLQPTLVALDRDWSLIAQANEGTPVSSPVTADNLAYIIYTSGSTGKPKGVMVEHGSLTNLTLASIERFHFHANSRVIQFASFTFDASLLQITTVLAIGGRLYLPTAEQMVPGPALTALLQNEGITFFSLPPAVLKLLPQLDYPALELLMTFGDDCTSEQLAFWSKDRYFCNGYGPTECAIGATSAEMRNGTKAPPIGRPFANVQAFVLDRNLQPVPIGVPGELYLGGIQVARGYFKQPALSEEKFVPLSRMPFANDLPSTIQLKDSKPYMLYKTGDLVRYLPDGNLDFIGRVDQMVKLRGIRIELGEIESVLAQLPGVREALVVAREDSPGEKRLVAYIIPTASTQVSNADQEVEFDALVSELRTYLRQKLPDYMMPAAFVRLASVPLTSNGKVDRKQLPAPPRTIQSLHKEYVPAQNPTEELLATIWCEVLGLPQVGRTDNFFEIGGDSIISLQVISRARSAGLLLKPRQIFEAQTIAGLAQLAEPIGAEDLLPEQGVVHGEVPLLPIQHEFFAQVQMNVHHFNQSTLVSLEKRLDGGLLCQAMAYLMQHHDALRLRFAQYAGHWSQHYLEIAGDVQSEQEVWFEESRRHFSEVEMGHLSSEEQQALLISTNRTMQASLNITNGPLWRVVLFHCGAGRGDQLLVIIHHLVVDLVSWRILMPDLWQIYEQLAAGQTVALPAKSSSFQAWANWLQEYAQSEQLLAELPYWRSIVDPALPRLPVDTPNSLQADTIDSAQTVTTILSVAETQALLREAPALYHTQINDLLLTALVQSFAAWSGNRSLLIALEGHGREALNDSLDLSRTVGWFTSLFPVRLNLEGEDVGSAIKGVKEQLRKIPQHGIGYGLLRYMNSRVGAELAQFPTAEVSFNYGGQFSGEKQIESLGDEQDGREARHYRFNVNGLVMGEEMSFTWRYSPACYRRETVEQLAQGFVNALRTIIAHCQSPEAGGYTPSDFPDIGDVDQTKLDNLLAAIDLGFEE